MNYGGTTMDTPNVLINKLTLEEKAQLLCGVAPMHTFAVERLGIPSINFSDGPHGVRKMAESGDSLSGISNSLPTTCFPPAATSACSFNPDNLYKMGKALGEECKYYDINLLLGPAINIQKNPLCGRNFEYFSEDPKLAGDLGIELVKGVQSQGVGTSLKHFACNSNEDFRMDGESVVDERALREIYLRSFERVVSYAKPTTLMCAYNKLNGAFCSENKWLLTDVLRDDWGFDGLVMSDWGAVKDRDKGVEAGLDLEMPGSIYHNVQIIIDAVKDNTLSIDKVDKAVLNLLKLIERTRIDKIKDCDFDDHDELSMNIALDSAVLLKNQDDILPLDKTRKYLVIGDFFKTMRYQGSGSSLINAHKLTSPEDAFNARGIKYDFARGYKVSEINQNINCEDDAIKKAKDADIILYFGGQSDYVESEGFDRSNMKLSDNQLLLIQKLIQLKKKIVFVMFGGSPVELPFENDMSAILNMLLPGQAGGEACARLLFGESNPCGKLAQTWPINYSDVINNESYASGPIQLYKESIFVGYRYYNTFNVPVRYSFGYGLSYSNFWYSNLIVKTDNQKITLSFEVENRSNMSGKEVCQVYVSGPKSNVYKPLQELRAYKKVYIEGKEKINVSLDVSLNDLRYYDIEQHKWLLESGLYIFKVGKSSENIKLKQILNIFSDDKPSESLNDYSSYFSTKANIESITDEQFKVMVNYKEEEIVKSKDKYTFETPLKDLNSFFGKRIYGLATRLGQKEYKNACKLEDGPQKEAKKKSAIFLLRIIPDNSLRSLCYSAGGKLKYEVAQALLALANGHIFKAIKWLCARPKK